MIQDVYTLGEAAELWGIKRNSLLQVCMGRTSKGFTDEECRQSQKYWLVTRQGMERLYGKRENK